jgi:hypothetical protein
MSTIWLVQHDHELVFSFDILIGRTLHGDICPSTELLTTELDGSCSRICQCPSPRVLFVTLQQRNNKQVNLRLQNCRNKLLLTPWVHCSCLSDPDSGVKHLLRMVISDPGSKQLPQQQSTRSTQLGVPKDWGRAERDLSLSFSIES